MYIKSLMLKSNLTSALMSHIVTKWKLRYLDHLSAHKCAF